MLPSSEHMASLQSRWLPLLGRKLPKRHLIAATVAAAKVAEADKVKNDTEQADFGDNTKLPAPDFPLAIMTAETAAM